MFERFTDRARKVVVLAQEEARTLDHNYIGTEHILLGLIREGEGVAAQVLGRLSISLEDARARVAEIIGRGDRPAAGQIPFTPRAKKVLELALREALQLGHDFIGTEHILLGLVREAEGVAAQVLTGLGADLDAIRLEVMAVVGASEPPARPARSRRRRRPTNVPRCPSCRADLRSSLASVPVEVPGDGGDTPMRIVFCRACGRTISVSTT